MSDKNVALITGASSGIGRDMARKLSNEGYNLILVARNMDKLEELKSTLNTEVKLIQKDLSVEENCISLYEEVRESNINILINNAGFGVFGNFTKTDINKEIQLIHTNIIAVHLLTKLFLKDMVKKNTGHILNVASIAGFMPGPLMTAYYASKAYIVRLTEGIKEELKKEKSNVKISLLCPGPVETNFNNVADVKFSLNSLSSEYVANYAIDKMLKNKFLIIPGIQIKLVKFFSKISPNNITSKVVYHMQKRKI